MVEVDRGGEIEGAVDRVNFVSSVETSLHCDASPSVGQLPRTPERSPAE